MIYYIYVFLDDHLLQKISQTTFRVTLNNGMRYWREATNVLKSTYDNTSANVEDRIEWRQDKKAESSKYDLLRL